MKQAGYSLLETLVAIGIASIVLTSALGVVASIHFSQKRLQFSQDFYAEGRYLMERVAQTIRNNTIDYDNFFIELGPPDSGGGSCGTDFAVDQLPSGAIGNNSPENRAELTYESIFFWDTNGDGVQNRNLGGRRPDGTNDPCSLAWSNEEDITTLHLINAGRNVRTAVSFVAADNDVQIRRQLAADIDDDGRVDIWGPLDANGDGDTLDASAGDVGLNWDGVNNRCEITFDTDSNGTFETFLVLGEAGDQDFCEQAFEFTSIVPPAIRVNQLLFRPAPNLDPFLAFRVDNAQVHPHVFVYLDLELDRPDRYGFEEDGKPEVTFQTVVGSRVFGNIRR